MTGCLEEAQWMRGGCRAPEEGEERGGRKIRLLRDADHELCPLCFAVCMVGDEDESGGRAVRKGQMQMEAQQWKPSALFSFSSFVVLSIRSIISFSACFRCLSPHLLVSPTLLPLSFSSCPLLPRLFSSLVSHGALW